MNSILRVLLMLVLTAGLLAAHSALPQSIVNGSISGSVVAGNSEPLPNAKVTLVAQNVRTVRSDLTGTTDKDGHFQILDVPPGLYAVAATADGFVRSSADMSMERFIAAVDSGKDTNFVVFMAKETVVDGRVFDPDGSPSSGAQVRIYTLDRQPGQSSTRVDENGHFKLNVAPGRFLIAADYEPAETDSARTYYPGVINRQYSIPLKVDEGETLRDINIHLQAVTRVRVSGVVRDSFRTNSTPSGNAYLEQQGTDRRPAQDFSPSAPVELLSGKGDPQFQFEAIKSGDYDLYVVMSDGVGGYHVGKLSITIGTSDVKDLVIVVRPGVDVKGRIIAQGTVLPDNFVFTPVLIPLPEVMPQLIQTVSKFGSVTIDSPTEFTMTNVPPGEYAIRLVLPPDLALIESRKGTLSSANGSYSFSADSAEPLSLTIGPAGTVSGIVTDPGGKPAPMAPVLLLPEKSARLNTIDFRRAATDRNGNYQIRGVAPGNYVILSMVPFDNSDLEQNEWRGYPVSVTPGGIVTMNLPFLGGAFLGR